MEQSDRAQRYYPEQSPQTVRKTKTQKLSRLSLKEKEETTSFRRKKPRHGAGFKNGYAEAAFDLLRFLKKAANRNEPISISQVAQWAQDVNDWREAYDDSRPPEIV